MKIQWAHLIFSIICGSATLIVISYLFYTNPPTTFVDIFALVLGCVFGGAVAGAGLTIWYDSLLEEISKRPKKN